MYDNSPELNDPGLDPGQMLTLALRLANTRLNLRELVTETIGWEWDSEIEAAVGIYLKRCEECKVWIERGHFAEHVCLDGWIRVVGNDDRRYLVHPADLDVARQRGIVKRTIEEDVKLRTPVAEEDLMWLREIKVRL
jgi:hypothetical protein